METWFHDTLENLFAFFGLTGYMILLVTIPLAVVQGFLGIFPFYTLVVIHISTLGFVEGLIVSWLAGALSAIIVFLVCKFLFKERFQRKWGHKLERYEKWQTSFDRYGIWAIIVLRTIPIMPNNLISFMSALSPIRTPAFVWSSVIGVLSHIWLLGIVNSLLFPDVNVGVLITSYAAFCILLLGAFAASRYREIRLRAKRDKGAPTAL